MSSVIRALRQQCVMIVVQQYSEPIFISINMMT